MTSHSNLRMARTTNSGFTLGEVAISAALLTIGVLVLVLFIPAGLKAQQQARFKLYAAAQVVDMIETFTSSPQIQAEARLEAAAPWDVASGYAAYQPDFEQKLSSPMYGIAPVPTRIAQRLDSADNLIQKILAEGGRLYFTNPRGSAGLQANNVLAKQPPSDAQRIVFAVIGSPQQNALPHLPMQAWPQYIPYPCGPLTVQKGENVACSEEQADPEVSVVWNHDFGDADGVMSSGYVWYAGQIENDQLKYKDRNDTGWSSWGHQAIGRNMGPGWLSAKYYVALALWYAAKKGVPTSFIKGTPSSADIAAAASDPDQVRAIRILAHAGMCLTKHFTLDPAQGMPQFGPQAPLDKVGPTGGNGSTYTWYESIDHPGLRTGISIPGTDTRSGTPVVVPGRTQPVPVSISALYGALGMPAGIGSYLVALGDATFQQAIISHATIVQWHEHCMQVAMAAAANPYDWRIPRPTNRALCTDFPLTQWDVCTTPRSGVIAGTQSDPNMPAASGVAKQWWAIAGMPVKGGQAVEGYLDRSFDWSTETGSSKGNQKHYNLGAPFSAAERTRMLVFWAVDWTEYNDFETAPSAQVDASRYMICPPTAPMGSFYRPGFNFTTDRMGRLTDRWNLGGLTGLNSVTGESQMSIRWYDRFQPCSRNAEKAWLFIRPVTANIPGISDALTAGSGVLQFTIGPDNEQTQANLAHAYLHCPRDAVTTFPDGSPGDRWDFTADQGWGVTYSDGTSCPNYPAPDGKKRVDGRLIFSGCFGGDRNGDRELTKGPLPAAVRLRAVEVGRFLFYDPRLTMNLR